MSEVKIWVIGIDESFYDGRHVSSDVVKDSAVEMDSSWWGAMLKVKHTRVATFRVKWFARSLGRGKGSQISERYIAINSIASYESAIKCLRL